MALFTAKKLTINSFKIGKVVEKGATDNSSGDIYMDRNADICKEKVTTNIDANTLPAELATETALLLLNRAQQAGWLDDRYFPLVSKAKAALIAHAIGCQLGIPSYWKLFEQYWNNTYLQQYYQKGVNQANSGDFMLELSKVLNPN